MTDSLAKKHSENAWKNSRSQAVTSQRPSRSMTSGARFFGHSEQNRPQRHVKRTRHGVKQDQRRISDLFFDVLDRRPAHPGFGRQCVLGNTSLQPQPLQLGDDISGKILRLVEIQIPRTLP